MRRIASAPRSGWQEKVEAAGLTWHTGEQAPYWNESAFYEFTAQEADLLADVTHELEVMALKAVQYAIDNRLYSRMGIPEAAVPLIERSWEARTGPARPPEPSRNSPAPAAPAEVPSLYGRFDLVYDGCHPPKLLEYNAD